MTSKHWMYAGCAVIAVSNILQAFGVAYPALPILSIVGIGINTISVPLTIIQAQKSAVESQEQFDQERAVRETQVQYVYSLTPLGRLMQSLHQMQHKEK